MACVCVLVYAGLRYTDVVEVDKNRNWQLTPQRMEKLHEDTIKLENAIQYALLASKSQWYPCLSCADTSHIFLKAGEIWKYGYTINSIYTRYTKKELKDFEVQEQFRGSVQQCMLEERKKIANYPLLPENQARALTLRLASPPGNPFNH